MCIQRIRADFDGFEVKFDACFLAEFDQLLMDLKNPVGTAEFLLHVAIAILALARNCRIELERSPIHAHVEIRIKRKRAFQPLASEKTPRANDIRHHVDREFLVSHDLNSTYRLSDHHV